MLLNWEMDHGWCPYLGFCLAGEGMGTPWNIKKKKLLGWPVPGLINYGGEELLAVKIREYGPGNYGPGFGETGTSDLGMDSFESGIHTLAGHSGRALELT